METLKIISICFVLFVTRFYGARSDSKPITCTSNPETDGSNDTIKVTRLTSKCPYQTEGPFWDKVTEAWYYVDTVGNAVHKFDYKTNRDTFAYLEPNVNDCDTNRNISAIFTIKDELNGFVVTYDRYLCTFNWDGESETVENFTKVFTIEDRPEFQCNDAKVSPSGVFVVGTAAVPFALEVAQQNPNGYIVAVQNNKKTILKRGWPFSNGMSWSTDEKQFYMVDSLFPGINGFDYDKDNVSISNETTVFYFEKYNIKGFPDGQAIDIINNIWFATYNGTELIYMNPKDGTLIKKIKIETVFAVTSLAFGGPNLDELLVTTSSRGQQPGEEPYPYSGCVFKVTGTNTKGFAGVPIDRSVFS